MEYVGGIGVGYWSGGAIRVRVYWVRVYWVRVRVYWVRATFFRVLSHFFLFFIVGFSLVISLSLRRLILH